MQKMFEFHPLFEHHAHAHAHLAYIMVLTSNANKVYFELYVNVTTRRVMMKAHPCPTRTVCLTSSVNIAVEC